MKCLDSMNKAGFRQHLTSFVFASVLLATPVLHAEGEKPSPSGKAATAADHSDPAKTYHAYLEAVKRDDVAAAKACHAITSPKDAAAVDLAVGLWVSHHRFQKLVTGKFGKRESPYLRDDCSEEALDRTLSRLDKSPFTTKGETADLQIRWDKDDSVEHAVFGFSGDEPLTFRKADGLWKIKVDTPETQEEITAPGTWGWAFREATKLLNEASDMIEAGKLNTWEQVSVLLDERTKKMEKQYAEDRDEPVIEK